MNSVQAADKGVDRMHLRRLGRGAVRGALIVIALSFLPAQKTFAQG